MPDLLLLAVVAVCAFSLGRHQTSRVRLQNRGEARAATLLKDAFPSPEFHLLNNVTLPTSDGSTQVDHILVSRYGVFVIETKDYKRGLIFADAHQPQWTQMIGTQRFQFQNPVRQNFKHVCTLRELLEFLPPESVSSAVVFVGAAQFRTPLPDGVFTLTSLIEHIRSQREEKLSANRVQFCVGRIETTRFELTRQTDIEHREHLQEKYGHMN